MTSPCYRKLIRATADVVSALYPLFPTTTAAAANQPFQLRHHHHHKPQLAKLIANAYFRMASYYMLTTLAFTIVNLILLVVSVVSSVAGIKLIGFGLEHRSILGYGPLSPPLIVLTAAVFAIVLCVIGSIGTFTERRQFLLTYFFIMLLIFCSLMVGMIITFVQHRSIMQQTLYSMKKSILSISPVHSQQQQQRNTTIIGGANGRIKSIIHARNWDLLQAHSKCCGFDGFADWTNSSSLNIPSSCISANQPNNITIYYPIGCRHVVAKLFSKILMKSGIVSITLGAVQVACIVASLANYSYVRRSDLYV